MKRGLITVNKEEKVYSSHMVDTTKFDITKPDGSSGIYSVAKVRDGVAILPIDNEGNVYLIENYFFAMGRRDIAVATGAVEDNEKPLKTAKRELKEELGIEAKEWIPLGTIDRIPSLVDSTAIFFIAKNLTFGEPEREVDEDIKNVKMKFEEAHKMVMENEIFDDSSVALILKAKEYLKL